MAILLRWSAFCIFALILTAISAAQAELTESAVENEVKKLLAQYEESQAEMTKTFGRIVEVLVSKRVHMKAPPVQENDLETDYKQPLGTLEHVDLQKVNHKEFGRSSSEDLPSTIEPNQLQPKVAASDAKNVSKSYNATENSPSPPKAGAYEQNVASFTNYFHNLEAFTNLNDSYSFRPPTAPDLYDYLGQRRAGLLTENRRS